ncbi:septin and tuftelin-interacting protein 1 homolog 1-like [Argentina anserina]|uniref:septin and tuftelin-interacting protein 1 homolog 1-like n=1 Tax=Argentina anserina TaxID=57926 RepID=UPI0021763D52|nr:septin and tuftelin-interacting protein 1 homolog 1-like [Potentilla anserina]
MEEEIHGSRKRRRQEDGNVGGLGLTAGIGMQMMKNMGYKGGGLGKNEQGMINPIQPKSRPKNLGMGFHGYNETKTNLPNSQQQEEEPIQDESPTKHDGDSPPMPTWKKNVINKQQKDFCLAEFLAQKMEQEQRVEAVETSENLNDEGLSAVLKRLDEANVLGELTLESLAEGFADMRRRCTDDCKLLNLSRIVLTFTKPLFNEMFQGWDPLRNPRFGFDIVSTWKGLLPEECCYTQLVKEVVLSEVRIAGLNSWQAEDPEPMLEFLEAWKELLPTCVVHDILDMVVLPELKFAVQLWEPNLGTVPIHLWVHPWLPLLFELGDKYQLEMSELFGIMRLKLCNFLTPWHPRDGSGYNIVSPWKYVFDSCTWELIMSRYVVPKLEIVLLDEFEVNPVNQKLDQFNWVLRWASAIPMHLMVNVMVKGFFPKWIEGLHFWLETNPNFENVANWYRGWKELIPKEFHANESIRCQLECGLSMMNRAVEEMEVARPGLEENSRVVGKAVRAARENLEGQTNMDDIDHEMIFKAKNVQVLFEAKKRAAAFLANARLGSTSDMDDISHQMNLRDVIEAEAQEHGLLFRPKPGRRYDGHQVYGFGNVNIMVDFLKEKIYAQTEETWSLVSLERLLELHMNKETMSFQRPLHT